MIASPDCVKCGAVPEETWPPGWALTNTGFICFDCMVDSIAQRFVSDVVEYVGADTDRH